MKKKKIFKIISIILIVIIVLILVVKGIIGNFSEKINNVKESDISYYFNIHEVKTTNIQNQAKGTGEITSFNTKKLDVNEYSEIKESYVKDGEKVNKNQKLLKITNNGYTEIVKAPIAGLFFKLEDNDYVIYDINDIGVEIAVNEKDVANLKEGQKAIVKISSLNKEIEGTVTYVSKLPINGKFKVKIKIDYFEELRFGYGANVKITISEKTNALVIPYKALQLDEENKYYVVKEEKKEEYYNASYYGITLEKENRTYVEVGLINNNEAEIISGLSLGDKILEWTW